MQLRAPDKERRSAGDAGRSVGNDVEPPAAADSVQGEISAVRGEHEIGPSLFGQGDEGGIGIVHGEARVLLDELASATQRSGRGVDHDGAASQEEIDTGGASSSGSSAQVSRLRENGLRAEHRPGPRLEEPHARSMLALIPVEQRDERSRVEQQAIGHCSAGDSSAIPGCTGAVGSPGPASPTRAIQEALGLARPDASQARRPPRGRSATSVFPRMRHTWRRGSSQSRRPSPSRFMASTVSMIARPGNVEIHQASRR